VQKPTLRDFISDKAFYVNLENPVSVSHAPNTGMTCPESPLASETLITAQSTDQLDPTANGSGPSHVMALRAPSSCLPLLFAVHQAVRRPTETRNSPSAECPSAVACTPCLTTLVLGSFSHDHLVLRLRVKRGPIQPSVLVDDVKAIVPNKSVQLLREEHPHV